MGIAFGVALVLIYILIVGEFSNFVLPAIIMAPIPLTLLGIIPGHWMLGAEFTATSMIGFIALAGIIVRNSILLVDFARHEVWQGREVSQSVVLACETRTRPIMITAFALVAGSSVILFDPIFQGMAVSLLFGVLVSTVLTLIVIPLGCISGHASFAPPGPPEQQPGGGVTKLHPPSATPAEAEPQPERRKRAGGALMSALGKIGMAVMIVIGAILMQLWAHVIVPLFRAMFRREQEAPKPAAQQRVAEPGAPQEEPVPQAVQDPPVVTQPASAEPGEPAAPAASASAQTAEPVPVQAVSVPAVQVREPEPTPPEPAPIAAAEHSAPAARTAVFPVPEPSPPTAQPNLEDVNVPEPSVQSNEAALPAEESEYASPPARVKPAPKRRGIRLKPGMADSDNSD